MVNKTKSSDDKCSSKTFSLPGWMRVELEKNNELTGENGSKVVCDLLEEKFKQRSTLEGQIAWRAELTEKRDKLNVEIARLDASIAAAEQERAQRVEQAAKAAEVRKLPDYQAAVAKVADNYVAMMKSKVINENNKTYHAEPVATKYGINVEFVIMDAEAQAEVIRKTPVHSRISPARMFAGQ